jgi:hypothetical protein
VNTTRAIAVGQRVYAITGGLLQIVDMSDPAHPRLIGGYSAPQPIVSFQNVDDIAYLTTRDSLQIVDVAIPANSALVGSYSTFIGEGYDVQVVDQLSYYLTTDPYAGKSMLHIIDVSDPARPTLLSSFASPVPAHTVHVADDVAYLTTDTGLLLIDIHDPARPGLLGRYATPWPAVDVWVASELAYIALRSPDQNPDELLIVDISNPASPTLRGRYATLKYVLGVQVVDDLAYIFGTHYLEVVDVSDPANPAPRGTYTTTGENINQIQVVNTRAYLTVSRPSTIELQIMDVSDPAHISIQGRYAVGESAAASMSVAGDRAYVRRRDLSGWGDLRIFDVSDPTNPRPQATSRITFRGYNIPIAAEGRMVYVPNERLGLTIMRTLDAAAFLPFVSR